jgi:hypothetical protein
LVDTLPDERASREANHLADLNGDGVINEGEKLGCLDYLGIAGPSENEKNPTAPFPPWDFYGANRGVMGVLWQRRDPANPAKKTGALLNPKAVRPKHITDGLSKTLTFAESGGRGAWNSKADLSGTWKYNGAWAAGHSTGYITNGQVNPRRPDGEFDFGRDDIMSQHPGGAQALRCDSSVQFLPEETDPAIVQAFCTKDNRDSFGENLP